MLCYVHASTALDAVKLCDMCTQINYGVLNFMDDTRGPEKLLVILDCRGATAMQVSSAVHKLLLLQFQVTLRSRSCLGRKQPQCGKSSV